MATTVISSYADLQNYLNATLKGLISSQTGNDELQDTETQSPHGAFWNTLTYEQFVTGNVPNVFPAMPILVKGSSQTSNIILALQGAAGTPFDPNTGSIGQMPADGPPFFTAAQIQPVSDWIDAGCPN